MLIQKEQNTFKKNSQNKYSFFTLYIQIKPVKEEQWKENLQNKNGRRIEEIKRSERKQDMREKECKK